MAKASTSTRVPAAKTPSVPALERGLHILDLVANSRSGLTFSQLTRMLDYPASSVHCLLITLERLGYLYRSENTGRYFCGMELVRIANCARDGMMLREKAAPVLRDLGMRTGLTVHLAVRERNEAMVIAKVSSIRGQQVSTWIGKRIDLHCTSLGKCLIAWLPDAEVDELIREHGLLRYNENTLASARKLKQDLQKTRLRGYAIDNQEEEIGMCCIGAPVFDEAGSVVAAVSISGSMAQIDLDECQSLVEAVQQTSRQISIPATSSMARHETCADMANQPGITGLRVAQ